jgi:hypothetical protein
MAPAELSRLRLAFLVVGLIAVMGLGVVASLITNSPVPGGSNEAVAVTISISSDHVGVNQTLIVSGGVSVPKVVSGYKVFLEVDGAIMCSSNLPQTGQYTFSCSFAIVGQKTLVVGFTSTGSYQDKSNVYSRLVNVTVTP